MVDVSYIFNEFDMNIAVFYLELEKGPSRKVRIPGETESTEVVLFNRSVIWSPRHAAIAAYRAKRAFLKGINISKSMRGEVASCLLGERQVSRAMELADPSGSDNLVAIVVSDPKPDWYQIENHICERLDAKSVSASRGSESLLRLLSLEQTSCCSDRIELLILEKAALLELDR